jgi:hypothetical protein
MTRNDMDRLSELNRMEDELYQELRRREVESWTALSAARNCAPMIGAIVEADAAYQEAKSLMEKVYIDWKNILEERTAFMNMAID